MIYVTYGQKDNSYSFSLRTIDPNLPDMVKDVFLNTLYDSDVKISWTNPDTAGFAGTLILRNNSNEISDDLDTTSESKNKIVFRGLDTTFIDKGLLDNTTYYYKIFSYNLGLDFSIGKGGSILVLDTIAPPQIAGMDAFDDYSEGSINLNWNNYPAPFDIANYRIYYDSVNFQNVNFRNPVSTIKKKKKIFKTTGLTNDKSYYFAVVPVDRAGNSNNQVNTVTCIPTGNPAKIASLAAVDDKSDGKVNLDWSGYLAPSDIDKYEIYLDTVFFLSVESKIPVRTINSDKKASSISGLKNDTLYYFAIVPVDKAGNKIFSVETKSCTPTWDSIPPDPITKLFFYPEANDGYIKLDWEEYIPPGDFRYYRIYRNTQKFNNISGYSYETTAKQNVIITDLEPGKNYYFAVTAVDINYNEDTNVTAIKVIAHKYNNFSISANVSNINIYIDGNYAYQGRYIGKTNASFKGIAKKHFILLQEKNGAYSDYYKLIDISSNSASLNVTMSLPVDSVIYNSSKKLITTPMHAGLASPFIVDWNNDGKKDLIAGDRDGEIWLYLNIGTDASPALDIPVRLNMGKVPIDVGDESSPFVVDWNDDSKKDLIIGNKDGKIYFIENTEDDDNPVFFNTTLIYSASFECITPFVVNWDGDMNKDIIFGTKEGNIYLLKNTGTDESPDFSESVPEKIQNLNINGYSAPFFVNWDYIGKRDILTGNLNGNIQIYLSENTNGITGFPSNYELLKSGNNEINTGGRLKPFIVDWNNDSILDVIAGEEDGNIIIYTGREIKKKTNGSWRPCFISRIISSENKKPENKLLKRIRDKFFFEFYITKKIMEIYYVISPNI
ncbi:hypothetical protein HY745_02355 [Candidatus Desantisbacteria bacterium]|nr:hypothetical protein [Candidatus Desantisbacteria bacterium]